MLVSYKDRGCALLSIDSDIEENTEPSVSPKYLVDFLRKVNCFQNYTKEEACKIYLHRWPEFEELITEKEPLRV